MSSLLYLGAKDVERALADLDPMEIVAEALALHANGGTVLPEEAYLSWGEAARSLVMPGFLGAPFDCAGVKIINANPHNLERGLPRASGLVVLFDPETAQPVCLLEGARISALRTAAVTALAADLLATSPVTSLAIVGAGALAEAHLALLLSRLPELSEIRIFDTRPERAATLAGRFSGVTVASSAEEAVRGAELVVPVTTATEGYIALDWLRSGCLLVNVSLDDVLPEVVLGAHRLIVDDWRLIRADERRLLGRMARDGLVDAPDAELGELVTGRKPGRTREDELILVNPFGLAIEDLALASRVLEAARELGLGTTLNRV